MVMTGDEALIGRVLNDRYLIGKRIARGGMASVFWATDQRLDRPVAIKVMHHGLGDDRQFTERFHREAKSAAKLNHPNVVSVFDQGMDGDVTYLVMEYVPGRTLRDIMREESPMPPYRALELLEQILIALSAAHAAHIIHRDVKPENVLITPDRRGQGRRLRSGPRRQRRHHCDRRHADRHGVLPRTRDRRQRGRRRPLRRLRVRRDALRDADRGQAALGRVPDPGRLQARSRRHRQAVRPAARTSRRIVDALVARATVRDRDQRSTDARVMLQQVRSVQRALDAGIGDDPELVADLLPGARITDDDGEPTEFVKRGAINLNAGDSEATQAVRPLRADRAVGSRSASEPVQPLKAGLLPPVSSDDYRADARRRTPLQARPQPARPGHRPDPARDAARLVHRRRPLRHRLPSWSAAPRQPPSSRRAQRL